MTKEERAHKSKEFSVQIFNKAGYILGVNLWTGRERGSFIGIFWEDGVRDGVAHNLSTCFLSKLNVSEFNDFSLQKLSFVNFQWSSMSSCIFDLCILFGHMSLVSTGFFSESHLPTKGTANGCLLSRSVCDVNNFVPF